MNLDLAIAKDALFKFDDPIMSFNGSTKLGRELNLEWNKIFEARQKIYDCLTLDEIKAQNNEIAKLCKDFKSRYETVEDSNVIRFINCLSSNVVYSEEANNWMEEYIADCKKDDSNSVLKEITEYVSGNRPKLAPMTDKEYAQIREQSFEIMNKFNLGSIVLRHDDVTGSRHFLNMLEKNLNTICEKTGINPEDIGHDGKLGFELPNSSVSGHEVASFTASKNSIQLSDLRVDSPSTVFHEWVHSLDFKVGNDIKPGSFATDIEESVIDDGSIKYKAFRAIKDLAQKFSNSKLTRVEEKKDRLFKEGTSKFLFVLLGTDYLSVNKEVRLSLNSDEMLKDVNNYLTEPGNKTFIEKLESTFSKHNLLTEDIKEQLNNPSQDLMSIKSFFDATNKNILGHESSYYMRSNFSNMIRNFQQKDSNHHSFGNSGHRDYYTQPTEMLARYFESQFFQDEVKQSISYVLQYGRSTYVSEDKKFLENKDVFFDRALSKDMSHEITRTPVEVVVNRVGEIRARALKDEAGLVIAKPNKP